MKFMLFRKLLPLLAAFAFVYVGPARAQFAVYGTADGGTFGGVTCPAFAGPCAQSGGHVKPYGGTFGAYYDFRDMGPLRIGADVRGDVLTSNKRADSSAGAKGAYRQYTALAGLRGSIRTPISWLHPYAEIAGGYTRNDASGLYTETTTTYSGTTPVQQTSVSFNPEQFTNYALFKGFVGVDVRVLPWMDIRAIEFGAGEAFGSAPTVQTVTATVNANGAVTTTGPTITTTSPNTHFTDSIAAGVVFRFP